MVSAAEDRCQEFMVRLLLLAKERDPELYIVVRELVIEAAGDLVGINLEGIDRPLQ